MMLAEAKSGKKYKELLDLAVKYVERRGFGEIKADLEGYEYPNSFLQKEKDNAYIPDITASNNRGKYYFEIAQKTEEVNRLVSKWKLLSTIAEMKNGELNIFVPFGQNKFTEELVDQFDIKANIIKLD